MMKWSNDVAMMTRVNTDFPIYGMMIAFNQCREEELLSFPQYYYPFITDLKAFLLASFFAKACLEPVVSSSPHDRLMSYFASTFWLLIIINHSS